MSRSRSPYGIDVADEIVVARSSGGRTTFTNAARTQRKGVEIGWQGRLGEGWEAAVAYTWTGHRGGSKRPLLRAGAVA